MKKLEILLRVVGVIQIALGISFLAVPAFTLEAMGLPVPTPGVFYPLGMLASRFLVVGAVFLVIAEDPVAHRLWIVAMVFIQLVDLALGLVFTATGVVSLAASLFPMFNAAWIATLLFLWRPRVQQVS